LTVALLKRRPMTLLMRIRKVCVFITFLIGKKFCGSKDEMIPFPPSRIHCPIWIC
jgi:hypothetical protein